MRRREFITLLGSGAAAAWPRAASAQKAAGKIPRIGVLWHAGSAEEEGRYFEGFIEGLRDLGYIAGQNIILEHRFPNEMPDRFRNMFSNCILREGRGAGAYVPQYLAGGRNGRD